MANLIVNDGAFRADLFKIGRYLDYETASTTSTRVDFSIKDGSFVRRLEGNGFTADGDGAPLSGAVTGISEIKDGVTLFTLSGFSMSWAEFEAFSEAGDTTGFLAQILAGDDALAGHDSKDVISGFDGADTITGGAGNDKIMGEDGTDMLDGGAGRDTLYGGLGDDTYVVDDRYDRVVESKNAGTDEVRSAVHYTLASTLEHLELTGTDHIRGNGNSLDNRLTGNTGNNVLDGKRGADTMAGGSGDDLYIVDDAGDVVTEAASEGSDTVNSAVDYVLGDNVENLKLLGKVTSGTGNTLDNHITGNRYTNVLDGGAGNDTIKAGRGNDTLTGGDGDDILDGYKGTDCASYAGAGGAVSVDLAVTEAQNTGGAGTDVLTGIERLIGSDFGDTLAGNSKSNRIDGGAGADIMAGGTGNDTYVVDSTGDTVMEDAKSGSDVIESSVSYALADNIERLYLTGTDDIDATGNDGKNVLKGNDGDNRLDGGAGRDTLYGGLGDDTYVVDDRYDRVVESKNAGTDEVRSAVHYTLASTLEHLELTGTDHIRGNGNSLDNRLTGNTGNNVLDGKRGADTMAGGSGDDLYIVDDAGDVVTEAASEGSDTVNSAVDYVLGDNVENLKLLGKVTSGTGNTLDNHITGNRYTNVLDGGAGNDTIKAGRGNDTLTGGDGDDILDGYKGTDCASYAGAGGAVSVDLAVTEAQNTGGAGTDVLTGIERLIGSDFGDTLAGNSKSNRIDGGAGADIMAGGTGNDTYVVDSTGDTVMEDAKSGSDVIESSVSYALADNIERLYLTGTDDIDATGNDGKNVLKGNDGDNRLDGGAGRDTLYGGVGDDTYVVDDRYDRVVEFKNAGTDEVRSAVHYTLASTLEHLELTGTDHIRGNGNKLDNRLTGNSGDNRLASKQGNDTLQGGGGDDTLEGGSGDDLYVVSGSLGDHTLIKEYRGLDTLRFDGLDPFIEVTGVEREGDHLVFTFQAGGSLTLYKFFRGLPLETLEAWGLPFDMPTDFDGSASLASYLGLDVGTVTAGDDVIVGGNADNDDIHGQGGNDRIAGLGGDDTLSGDEGDDTLSGGAGDDSLVGGIGADSMDGGAGVDTASYTGSDVGVDVNLNDGDGSGGHADGDTLVNIENVVGSSHGDTLTGDGGGNRLDGSDGDDVLRGGAGADSLVGGSGSDTASYDGSNAAISVNLQTGTHSGGHAAGDTISGVENLTGSNLGDTLTGDTGANVLDGGAGNDSLDGGAGDDWLVGGSGVDTLAGGLGTDTLTGGADGDRFVFSGSLGDQYIADFGAGDRIDFAFGLVAHFPALDTNVNGILDDADANITIFGGHTIISVGGGQITVGNVIDLDVSDFDYF